MDLPKPEDVEGVLEMPFIVMYWPLLAGGVLALVALSRGHTWIAVPVAAAAVAFQALRFGLGS